MTCTVYIIDDDVQTANMLGKFVDLMGFKDKIYTSALSFFMENISYPSDSVLILDLNMPDMDGIEVMRQIAKQDKMIPLVLISGHDVGVLHSAEQLAKAHSIDILATLTKPLQFKILKGVLENYFNSSKLVAKPLSHENIRFSADELKNAILTGQIELHYQPQIDIKSGSLAGVEALVRWKHPNQGLIYPNSFISLAEENDLIGILTATIIEQAVDQAYNWKSNKLLLQVSVNISADNITSLSLPEQLTKMLETKKLDPSMITLEVTESVLMGELVTSLDTLTRLRLKGIELSIDDFGTGYSSLSQLYRAPFTELKVDQSFVMHMATDQEAYGIVETCVKLGHVLNMRVVAEGVENKETFDLLKNMGCDIAQGYYIARPMRAIDVIGWSQNRSL